MRQATLWLFAVICFLASATPASAERNWEFSVGGFGGGAFHADTTFRNTWAITPFGFERVNASAKGLRFEDADTFGVKLTAWYLPRRYHWSPQIGLELDGTRFTADVPIQTIPANGFGESSGLPIGFTILSARRELGVDNLAVNVLFRYPIWATPEMPQGRWHPYVGVGGGVQRARLSVVGYEETSYSPSFQALTGAKFFLMKYLAVFGEAKWTLGWHSFNYAGLGFPSDYREHYNISTVHIVGGVATHF